MWRSHPSLIRAHNLQILGIEQGSKPRIDRSFLLSSSSLQSQAEDTNTLSSSRSSPHHGRFFGPLDPTLLVSRPYDAGMPLCHLLPRLRSCRWHVTGWPLSSSVLSTPDTRLVKWSLQPRGGHKREALYPEPPIRKPHIRPSSASPLLFYFLQLALATLPLEHLSHLFRSSSSKLFHRLHPRRWEETQK
jgi:hypothetical protein